MSHETFTDVITPCISDTETSGLVKPGERTFNDPAKDTQATAMLGVSFCERRLDVALAKLPAMRFRIIPTVSQNTVGLLAWSAWFSADWRDVSYQGNQFFDVIHIPSSQDAGQRNALAIGNDVMFATRLGQAAKSDCRIAVLESLLAAGDDPNDFLASPDEPSPLEFAVSKDRIDANQWLLDHGADPNLGRPLIAAIDHDQSSAWPLAMLTLLLDVDADIHQAYPLFGDETKCVSVLDWARLYQISEDVNGYLRSRGAIHYWTDDTIAAAQREWKPYRIVP